MPALIITQIRALQILASTGRWFPEFRPVNFLALTFIFMLLKQFIRHNICCHVGGSFPTYLAGVQTNYHRVTVFISLKYAPLLNLLFRKGEELVRIFRVGPF